MIKENKVYKMESAVIVGDVKIGKNCIIAAGTVVAITRKYHPGSLFWVSQEKSGVRQMMILRG